MSRSVVVSLSANVANFVKGMHQATQAAKETAESTEDVEKATREAEQAAEKAAQNLRTMSNAMLLGGATLTAGLTVAVKKFSEFDQSMSNVAATGKDARDNMDQLRSTAMKLGADTAFSAKEAADGMEALLKAGVSAKEVVSGGLAGALSLAATDTMTVADAAEAAATAMTQFKLSGQDVPHIADLIAAGAGKAQGGVKDMADALKNGGLVASQFGLSLEETVGALSAFASVGLIGGEAGTSLKSMLLQLATPSKQQATLMAELGIAAYDAQGNFVGLTNLAGQLKEKLSGLDQASRDSAMGIIFGSYAIRAANVLYEQGAEGIEQWTRDVNEAGYAATVAATKQDNLRGDLEKLGGALDTVAIAAGSAVNGPLRGMVQLFTRLVDALAESPGMMQALAVAAALAATALTGAGLAIKSLLVAKEVKLALEAMNVSMVGWGKNAVAMSASAGVVVAALWGLRAASNAISESFEKQRASMTEMEVALRDMAYSGRQTARMTESLNAAALTSGSAFGDLGVTLKTVSDLSGTAGDKIGKFLNSAVGIPHALNTMREEVSKVDSALTRLSQTEAADAFKAIAENARTYGVTNEMLLRQFPEYRAKIEATAQAAGVFNLTQAEIVGWMEGTVPAAVKSAGALKLMGESHRMAAESAEDQANKLDALMQAQMELADAALEASNAEIRYANALAKAQETAAKGIVTINEATGKIDVFTKSGREAQTALNNLADASLRNYSQMLKMGATAEQLADQMAGAREEFVKVAQQMGLSEEQANAMANSFGLIPQRLNVEVSTTGARPSELEVLAFAEALSQLPKEAQVKIATLWAKGDYDAAKAALTAEDGKVYQNFLTTVRRERYELEGTSVPGGGRVMIPMEGKAAGGPVIGPGTGTSDSIAAWLSNGEHVLTAREVAALGGHAAVIRMRQLALAGRMPKFAEGGPVSKFAPIQPVIRVIAPHGDSRVAAGSTIHQTNTIIAQDPQVTARHLSRELRLAGV